MTNNDQTTYVVKVQRSDTEATVDEYSIEEGTSLFIEVTEAGDLWITKVADGDQSGAFVTTYARGCWVRCWAKEKGVDA